MTLRDKIAEAVREAIDNVHDMDVTFDDYAQASADAILDVIREGVKPLDWLDFDGRGAKANAMLLCNYIIDRWSDGRFEISVSAPGYSTGFEGERWHDTLESAKAAAQADYTRRILSALGIDQ